MKKVVVVLLSLLSLTACKTTEKTRIEWASKTGLSEQAINENCESMFVYCKFDKLKDTLQIEGSDVSGVLSLSGASAYNVNFTWVSSSSYISAYAIYSGHKGWIFADSAEIYVGKNKVAKLSSKVTRETGEYNEILGGVEVQERVYGALSFEQAKIIASAEPSDVTIRYYGRDGYTDAEGLNKNHDLMNVVNLALSKK